MPCSPPASAITSEVELLLAGFSGSDRIGALRAIVMRLYVEGLSEMEALAVLETQRARLEHANREDDQEIVMTVMDHVVGWCRPDLALHKR